MDFDDIEAVRTRHPAWRLLRADNAGLVLAFLGGFFVEANRGATAGVEVAGALNDLLDSLNTDPDSPRFPKAAAAYLDDWSGAEVGWLRRFYPPGSDDIHYEATPALEKANSWVESLRARSFVGTESRLHTVVELLRQIVHGTETDPDVRLAQLRRERDALDREIEAVESGDLRLLDETGVRDRYQQLSATARDLLSDFREVEENFRGLDRAARERIAVWDGSKGELLGALVTGRTDISSSDQGRSFQAFHDFLLSDARQDELTGLLAAVDRLEAVDSDRRLGSIHHEWSEAAERAQRTVRQISEQLRRFLDDRVWLENRRVIELVRTVETAALGLRNHPPDIGLDLDQTGVEIMLPFERPLYDATPATRVDSLVTPTAAEQADVESLFAQTYVDQARLARRIRDVVPRRSSALLTDIIDLFPIEQGAAEIVAYLALDDEDIAVELDETGETLFDYADVSGTRRRVRMPKVTVRRR